MRTIAVLAVVIVAVAAAAFGVTAWLGHRHQVADRRSQVDATKAADAYVTVMSGGDVLDLENVLDDPPDGEALVDSFRTSLRISSAHYTHGAVVRRGSTATTPYTADLVLTGLGHWKFTGTLTLRHGGAGWRVAVVPELLHPDRHAGEHITLAKQPGNSGAFVDVHGDPIVGGDEDLTSNVIGANDQSGLNRISGAGLTGGSDTAVVITDAGGSPVQTLKTFPGRAGRNIQTTLDLQIQRAGEAALAPVQNASLVAIDARTGGVLAAVNNPSSGVPIGIGQTFAPGSTFKIITATALLMNGVGPGAPIDCPASTVAGGQTFRNAEGHASGPMTVEQAFAQSCNTAFITLASRLPPGALGRAAALYGFGISRPLGVASAGGTFTEPSAAAEAAEDAIGQGGVEASALEMASVAAAVDSGVWRQPFVVGPPVTSRTLPDGVAGTLRTFMRDVVTTGTAAGVGFSGVVYGKTGTAEYGSGNPPPTHAWFVGFRGTVAFAVFVNDGPSGAATAAPLAASFLSRLP